MTYDASKADRQPLQSCGLGDVHPEPVPAALIPAGHFGVGVAKLLLHMPLLNLNLSRGGEAGAQAVAGEEGRTARLQFHIRSITTVCKRKQGRSLWPRPAKCPWFTWAVRDQRYLAGSRARVIYKECRRTPRKPLGKVQNIRILHI